MNDPQNPPTYRAGWRKPSEGEAYGAALDAYLLTLPEFDEKQTKKGQNENEHRRTTGQTE